MIFIYAQGPN